MTGRPGMGCIEGISCEPHDVQNVALVGHCCPQLEQVLIVIRVSLGNVALNLIVQTISSVRLASLIAEFIWGDETIAIEVVTR